jgi:hypothetical protein
MNTHTTPASLYGVDEGGIRGLGNASFGTRGGVDINIILGVGSGEVAMWRWR